MSRRNRGSHRFSQGQALVEFALVVLILLMMLFGIFEFGRAYYAYNVVTNAAREGARYGVVSPTDTGGIQTAAINTAVGLGLTAGNVSVSFPDGTSDSGNRIRVDVTYNFRADTPLVSPSLTLRGAATMTIE